MARAFTFASGLVCGLALGTLVIVSHADDVQAAVVEAAAVAHKDPTDLAGAVATTGVDPWTYLKLTPGELDPPPREPVLPPSTPGTPAAPTSGVFSSRVACIIRVESKGDPRAYNRSGASGLGQFLPSTWASTPQGRAGMSVWDPAANAAAIGWMLSVGRAREFDAVRFYGC